jgi:hypothetical protein
MDRTEKLTQRVPHKETTNTPNEQAHEHPAGNRQTPEEVQACSVRLMGLTAPHRRRQITVYSFTPRNFFEDSTLEATRSRELVKEPTESRVAAIRNQHMRNKTACQ